MIVGSMSRRRWFGVSIVLASAGRVLALASIHLSMAILGAILVGAGAGMAFLAGTTLLGGEIADDVRGRVFAVVQTGTRLVLMLAISLSSVLVGVGRLAPARPSPTSASRSSRDPAAAAGRRRGRHLRRDQRVQADGRQAAAYRCWPTSGGRSGAGRSRRPEPVRLARRVRGLRGRRGRRQVHPGHAAGRAAARQRPRGGGHPGSRAPPSSAPRIRGLVLDRTAADRGPDCRPGPRRCSTPRTGRITSPPWSALRWSAAPS